MRLFAIREMGVRIHWSLALYLSFLAAASVYAETTLNCLWGLLFPIFIFTTVLLHELGHAFVAQAYGLPVAHITLYPFGGIACIGFPYFPPPKQELVITGAGPLINLVLMGVFYPLVPDSLLWSVKEITNLPTLLNALFNLNLGMLCFNLLPAFPMDGGRLLRAAFSLFCNPPLVSRAVNYLSLGIFGLGTGLFWYYGLLIPGFLFSLLLLDSYANIPRLSFACRTRHLRVGDLTHPPLYQVRMGRYATVGSALARMNKAYNHPVVLDIEGDYFYVIPAEIELQDPDAPLLYFARAFAEPLPAEGSISAYINELLLTKQPQLVTCSNGIKGVIDPATLVKHNFASRASL